MATATSLYFLPIALVFSPLVYGISHLWASFRYVPYSVGGRERKFLLSALAVAVAGLISAIALLGLHFTYQDELGPAVLGFYALGFMWLTKSRPLKFVLLLPALPLYFYDPLATAAILVFAHNLVAFIYWYLAARRPREKLVVAGSLIMVTAISALIAVGYFDRALFMFSSNVDVPEEIVRAADKLVRLFTGESGVRLSMRWLAIFSVLQNMHYFIWLKAIGEQNLPSENPTSFARTFAKLRGDYGPAFCLAILISV
ncbi:MAG: hypothetical protein ACXWQE_05845, partial [Bdellovibrionales bacterium]